MAVVGVDTGGTFTDFSVEGRVHKVRSTPDDPSRAVLDGLAALGIEPGSRVVHGTTVATNALLTGRTARTAFVTTRGLEDLLEIARQDRTELFSLAPHGVDPMVPRAMRFGVDERLGPDGSVERALDMGDLVADLAASGAEAIAVCLLHSYRNDAHERAVASALFALGLPVSLSSHVAGEFREYERAVTTVANASLVPVLAPYIRRLASALSAHTLEILQSNGGTATPEEIEARPIATVLSGPAGGVVAATELARRHGIEHAVSFDMGGTSTDVALLRADHAVRPEFRFRGWPLRVPVLDVHTVGAGGGSIAHIDALGALRVGPQSAGAHPGPACYGVGDRATVTDAHLVLGSLSEADRLAGSLQLDLSRAVKAVEGRGADIVRVANATMERALRTVTVRRGVDPRGCTLVSFGGAGGLHACALASVLGMRQVLVPAAPGAFSAHGMRTADRRRDFVRTVLRPALDCDLGAEYAAFSEDGVRTADVRYEGQSYELSVPVESCSNDDLVRRFHAAHERAYGYAERDRAVEVVSVRVAAIDESPRAPLHPTTPHRAARAGPSRMARSDLDGAVRGPIVLTERTGTTVVPEGWRADTLADGTLRLEIDA